MKDIKLVALVSGQKKDGNGIWYRATLKGHDSKGNPQVKEYYLNQSVGEKAVREGVVEDCAVNVTFDFDEYLRPEISELTKASSAAGSKAQVTV